MLALPEVNPESLPHNADCWDVGYGRAPHTSTLASENKGDD